MVESLPEDFAEARVVTVDTSAPSQMDKLFDVFGERVSLMIDHHEKGIPYADALICATASCSEIILDIIVAAGVTVTTQMATLLYAGLSSDTGCFRYSNVREDTHMRAASLIALGIDAAEINRQLLESKSYVQLRAERVGFDRLHFYADGKVAVLTFPYELATEIGATDEHLGTLIDVARTVQGVELAAAIRGTASGAIRASLRANTAYDVATVAARFGGGGHMRAAGVTMPVETLAEAETLLAEALVALVEGNA